jgi:hypothetical protein
MSNNVLQEAYARTTRATGVNPLYPTHFRKMMKDRRSWNVFVDSLTEGLEADQSNDFRLLAENTRVGLLENSMFGLNPYETLTLPVLRRFYPKLIARDLVNVMPIDKPEVIKGFMRAYFGRYNDVDAQGNQLYPYQFPYVAPGDRKTVVGASGQDLVDISRGPSIGINATGDATNFTVDILGDVLGLQRSESHLEKDFKVLAVSQDGTSYTQLPEPIVADVDGNFSFDVNFDGTATDTVLGRVNFLDGVLDWQSVGGDVKGLSYSAVASLEENQINPMVKYTIDKIRFQTVLRQISAEWTIPLEQDAKALYDVNIQSELVNIIGEQIAAEIDREIIDALIAGNAAFNDISTHTATFNKNPEPGYTWGRKQWYENIIPTLTELSAQVYNDSLMDSANTIACNPLDAAIFESLNDFAYDGNSVAGGETGYRSATVQGGKWKILVSSIVPAGKMILKYRSNEAQRATYVYSPYVPALLTPYPLGAIPTLTVMTRYASKLIRPEALAVLNVVDIPHST